MNKNMFTSVEADVHATTMQAEAWKHSALAIRNRNSLPTGLEPPQQS
jgi:hypothetical protein